MAAPIGERQPQKGKSGPDAGFGSRHLHLVKTQEQPGSYSTAEVAEINRKIARMDISVKPQGRAYETNNPRLARTPDWAAPKDIVEQNLAFARNLGLVKPMEGPVEQIAPEATPEPTSSRKFSAIKSEPSSDIADTIIHNGIKIPGTRKDQIDHANTQTVVRLDGLGTLAINTQGETELILPNGNPRHVETRYGLNESTITTSSNSTRLDLPQYIDEKRKYTADTSIEITTEGITKTTQFTPDGGFNPLSHMEDTMQPSVFLLPSKEGDKPTNYHLVGAKRSFTEDGVKYVLPATDNLTASTVITFDLTLEGVKQTTRIIPIGKVTEDPDVQTARDLQRDPNVQAKFRVLKKAELESAAKKAKKLAAEEKIWQAADRKTPAHRVRLTRLFGEIAQPTPITLHSAEANQVLGADLSRDNEAEAVIRKVAENFGEIKAELPKPKKSELARPKGGDVFKPLSSLGNDISVLRKQPEGKPIENSSPLQDRVNKINRISDSTAGPSANRLRTQ